LKGLARRIIKKVDYPSRISYSDNGSVYIYSYFKILKPKASLKITTRISCHILQSKKLPDLDILFIQDCPDDEFVDDCSDQINRLISKRIECGE
jgi:hypothetical protein